MAEIKKYLDTTALGTLVEQIKAEDAKALAAAKKYTDDAGKLYDEAGSASTAETNAKAYTDALAQGAVATNAADIATLKGTGEGSVAKAVADAKALVDADVDAVEVIANKNKEDIAAINDGTNGILAQAKSYADTEDAKIEQEVADLAEYVGTIPEGATATDVVGYVIEKTTGIASQGAMTELTNRVGVVEGEVATIKGDYLKGSDKEELAGDIADVQAAVDAEAATARAAEEANAAAIKAISDDYLKAADKTELQNNINTVSGAVERLTNGVSADEVDGVNDLIQYVKDHGVEFTGIQNDVAENAEAISGVAGRMTTAEGKITDLEGAVATKVDKTAYDQKITALEGEDTAIKGRLDTLESAIGESGSVAEDIEAAKQAAIAAAAEDATTKANAAETNAKGHADSLNTAMNSRVEALEAIDHEHDNKALLDTYTQTEANLADAVVKKHEHSNLSVLEGVTAAKVQAWDVAEGNAKTYADGLNTAMTTKVDGIDGRVGTLESTITSKADASALADAVADIADNAEAIAANTSAINSFTAITPDEVNALFA